MENETASRLKIAGVPEHFNLPWVLAKENGSFRNAGIDLQWTDVPEGTGRLCELLRSGEIDAAVILTEGIIKDILAGNPSRIVQLYVQTPLVWGIHVAATSAFETVDDLEGKVAAISRRGSGSELMAYVNADNQGWDKSRLQFEIVNTIDGAVEALTQAKADYFMWEHFMTKPLVDNGTFRRVGDCPTPWPCFVIAFRTDFLENSPEIMETALSVINAATAGFKQLPAIGSLIAQRFGQKPEDIIQWLSMTEWSQHGLDPTLLNKIQNQLAALGIVAKKGTFADIVHV